MEEILIITDSEFPIVNAAATTRVYMLCKLFQSLGFQTSVFIMNVNKSRRFYLKKENIHCRWFADKNTKAIQYLKPNTKVINAVRNKAERFNLKYVILYQEILLQSIPIIKMAQENGFEVIAYFDEWYDWEKAKGRNIFRVYASNIRVLISEYVIGHKIKNKIVISRGLKKFYKNDNCFLLPTFVDLEDKMWENSYSAENEKVIIMYAGWPGGRDDLRLLVEAVDELSAEDKKRLLLRIFTYATTEKELRDHIPGLDDICQRNCGVIEFFSEAAREQVIELLKKSDFSYLLRKNKWVNNAGFSTKIGEGLAVGTPMLLNCTSDIKYYIKNGYNGILIRDMTKAAVSDSLHRILEMDKNERARMRRNAYRTAKKYFDYRVYKKPLKSFLDGIMEDQDKGKKSV